MFNLCWYSVHTFINNLSLLVVMFLLFQWVFPTIAFNFASVNFMFTTVYFSYFHFNKCHFHDIFVLACVSFNFAPILQVSFVVSSYCCKCHLLGMESVTHLISWWFVSRDKFGVNESYFSYRHVLVSFPKFYALPFKCHHCRRKVNL